MPNDEAFLHQVAEHFLDEKRVALGLTVNGLGQRPTHILSADRVQHAVDFVRGQPTQKHAGELPHTPELGERRRERVGAIHLDIAVGADD